MSFTRISDLYNSVKGAVEGIGSIFSGGNENEFFPQSEYSDILNNYEVANWGKLPFPYSFAVLNPAGTNSTKNDKFPKDFTLPIAPSEITQSEDFAINIQPTQGGTVVNHSGNRYKTLTIQGTTGIAPFRGGGGVDSATGKAWFQSNDLKYRSGYEVFQLLRNFFRTYYEYKKTDTSEEAKNSRLVFKNYKDGEFLIVELIKFNMKRSASKPFLYDYDLQFKVLANFTFEKPPVDFIDQIEQGISDAIRVIDGARAVFLRSQEILRQVEGVYNATILEPLRKISLALKDAKGVPVLAADVGNRIINNTLNTTSSIAILNDLKAKKNTFNSTAKGSIVYSELPLPNNIPNSVANNGPQAIINLNENLLNLPSSIFPAVTQQALNEEIEDVRELPKSFYVETVLNLINVRNNCEDAFSLSAPDYDSIFNRTKSVSALDAKPVTDQEYELLGALSDTIAALRSVLIAENLFKSEYNQRIESVLLEFDNQIQLQKLPAMKQIRIEGNTTLERIAAKELGDSNRWPEIAELNDLKYPYITSDITDTSIYVKKIGETLLIPQPVQQGFSNVPRLRENKLNKDMSEFEKNLGIDLKVDDNFDLVLTGNQDYSVVKGLANITQAVLLNFYYERGELIKYPSKGVGLNIGGKFRDLQEIQDDIVASLQTDPRIVSLKNLRLEREGSALYVAFGLILKEVDIPVPFRIRVQ